MYAQTQPPAKYSPNTHGKDPSLRIDMTNTAPAERAIFAVPKSPGMEGSDEAICRRRLCPLNLSRPVLSYETHVDVCTIAATTSPRPVLLENHK